MRTCQDKPSQEPDNNISTDDGGFNEVGRYEGPNKDEYGGQTRARFEDGTPDMNCSTPSSGFYSELGQERTELHERTDLQGTEFEHLYISPEQIRNKKHVKVKMIFYSVKESRKRGVKAVSLLFLSTMIFIFLQKT